MSNDTDTILVGATKDKIEDFVDDVQSLWLQNHHRQQPLGNDITTTTTIPILEHPPTSIEFLRDYVSLSRPCIIRDVNMHKSDTITTTITTDENHHSQQPPPPPPPPIKSLSLPTLDALVQMNPDLLITVDVTPDGYGDCIRKVRRGCCITGTNIGSKSHTQSAMKHHI
jgi:hypothetical protein